MDTEPREVKKPASELRHSQKPESCEPGQKSPQETANSQKEATEGSRQEPPSRRGSPMTNINQGSPYRRTPMYGVGRSSRDQHSERTTSRPTSSSSTTSCESDSPFDKEGRQGTTDDPRRMLAEGVEKVKLGQNRTN
jgi:hypothetical protein